MIDHPLRAALAAELHARPFLRLAEAVSLTHYAIYADGQPDIHETLLHALCRDTGIDAPHEGAGAAAGTVRRRRMGRRATGGRRHRTRERDE